MPQFFRGMDKGDNKMKIKFVNAEKLIDGIRLFEEELSFTVSENGDYTISITETDKSTVSVSVNGKEASITYCGVKARFF